MVEASNRRAVLEELQRLLSSISEGLDRALAISVGDESDAYGFLQRHVTQTGAEVQLLMSRSTLTDVLQVAHHQLLSDGLATQDLEVVSHAWGLRDVHAGLMRLDECLTQFYARGGDSVVGRLYGLQYEVPAILIRCLTELEIFPARIRYSTDAIKRLLLGPEMDAMRTHIQRVASRPNP